MFVDISVGFVPFAALLYAKERLHMRHNSMADVTSKIFFKDAQKAAAADLDPVMVLLPLDKFLGCGGVQTPR